jgi:hypothetical protein
MGMQHWVINIGKTEFFTAASRGARRTRAPGEMHTKRQMHSAQSIKMQMSFIHGGNICVRRESVFRLSVGRSAPAVSQHECVRAIVDTTRGLQRGEATLERDRATRSTSPGQIFILRPIRWINGNLEDSSCITIFRAERRHRS